VGVDGDGTEGGEGPQGGETPPYLTLRAQIAAGVIVAVTYMVSFILRDETLPGIVGGALAGVLTVLIFREIEARRRRRGRR
jgi:hypothetical protein